MNKGIMALVLAAMVAPAYAGDAKDEAALRGMVQDVQSAFNKSDAKALAALFAEDGDIIAPNGRMDKGRAEIEKNHGADMNGPFKGTTSEATVNSIRFVKPDVALVNFTHMVNGMKSPDGKDMPPMKVLVTVVAAKNNGKWWAIAARPMVPMAPPPMPATAAPAAPATPAK